MNGFDNNQQYQQQIYPNTASFSFGTTKLMDDCSNELLYILGKTEEKIRNVTNTNFINNQTNVIPNINNIHEMLGMITGLLKLKISGIEKKQQQINVSKMKITRLKQEREEMIEMVNNIPINEMYFENLLLPKPTPKNQPNPGNIQPMNQQIPINKPLIPSINPNTQNPVPLKPVDPNALGVKPLGIQPLNNPISIRPIIPSIPPS